MIKLTGSLIINEHQIVAAEITTGKRIKLTLTAPIDFMNGSEVSEVSENEYQLLIEKDKGELLWQELLKGAKVLKTTS